jgi:hypothetical protein
MRVRFADPKSAALFGTPKEAAPEPEPPPAAKAVAPVAVTSPPVAAVSVSAVSVSPDAPNDAASSGAANLAGAGPRRIVVDASTEKDEDGAPEPPSGDETELSGAVVAGETGRIPAPDALAFGPGGGGGRKGRRNRRR